MSDRAFDRALMLTLFVLLLGASVCLAVILWIWR
jgi:hypothetical protein